MDNIIHVNLDFATIENLFYRIINEKGDYFTEKRIKKRVISNYKDWLNKTIFLFVRNIKCLDNCLAIFINIRH